MPAQSPQSTSLARTLVSILSEPRLTSDNIEKNNIAGLGLHAIIQVAPLDSVFQIAAVLDQERRDGAIRGPLHGIPILVKDNIATASELGMATSAGNTALRELGYFCQVMP